MLSVARTDQSDTREAIKRPSLGDIPSATTQTAKPAPAGIEPQPDSARRGFCDDDRYAVVDIDMHNRGAAALQRRLLAGDFPRTATTRSKRGHGYLFYALPHGEVVQAGGIALDVGLTLKSAPGSRISARRYEWASDRPVVAAPQWLLDRISADTQSPQHMTDTTAPAAPATAPCINSNRTDDNMQARDAGSSDARADTAHDETAQAHNAESGVAQAETTEKTDNVVPFPLPPAVAETELARVFMYTLGTESTNKEGVLSANARHDLLAINPMQRGIVEAATFMPNEHADADKWIDEQGKKKWNVYISINEGRGSESLEYKLSKENIGAVRAVAVDLDPEKLPKGAGDPTGAHFRSERARLLQVVATICKDEKFPPSLVVDSGGGYWLLWLLDKKVAVTPEVFALAEGISHTLAIRFDGDSTFDLCRVMRLPGTINVPDAGKAAQGHTPAPAFILPQFATNKRYTLEQLAEWAPPTPPKKDTSKEAKEPIEWEEVQADTYEDLPAALREKFEAYGRKRPAVAKLWAGEPAPWQKGLSPSDFEYALSRALRDHGAFTSTEFAQLVAVWEQRSVKHAGEKRPVQRAWDNAPTPVGDKGFDATEIDESKAPPPKPSAPLSSEQPTKPSAPSGRMATPLRRFDPATLPPVPWVVRGLAARRAISTLTGPGGMSKSTWTLILAVAAASGRSDVCGYAMLKRECVWVWSQEDDIDQMELRVAAIMQAFGVSHDDMLDENGKPMLYINSGLGKGKRLNLAKRAGERIIDGEHLADLMASAQAIGASLVILDPLITLHQAPENDNVQMRAVFDLIGQVAVEANCAVLIVSHTGKPDKASSKGYAGDAYASRGASAQPDAGRANVTFMGMSEADTKAWRIPESASHLDYVRIDDAKFNLGKKRREPRWFKREEVVVRGFTGDSMEVLRPVELEPNVATGRPDLLEAIAKAMVDNLPPATPHATAAVAAHLPASMAAAIKGQNRARTINEAFGGEGVDEYMTNSGTLRRSKGTGNKGTMFTLLPADASLLTPQMLL